MKLFCMISPFTFYFLFSSSFLLVLIFALLAPTSEIQARENSGIGIVLSSSDSHLQKSKIGNENFNPRENQSTESESENRKIDHNREQENSSTKDDEASSNPVDSVISPHHQLRQQQHDNNVLPYFTTTNYASAFLGARLVQHHHGAVGAYNVLQDDNHYLQTKCSEPRKFFTVQLAREVQVTEIVLQSKEYFCSFIKDFVLLGSSQFPCQGDGCSWVVLGNFVANYSRDKQYFYVESAAPPVRFIRLLWVSHHSDEKTCTLTKFQAFGYDVLESIVAAQHHNNNNHNGNNNNNLNGEDDHDGNSENDGTGNEFVNDDDDDDDDDDEYQVEDKELEEEDANYQNLSAKEKRARRRKRREEDDARKQHVVETDQFLIVPKVPLDELVLHQEGETVAQDNNSDNSEIMNHDENNNKLVTEGNNETKKANYSNESIQVDFAPNNNVSSSSKQIINSDPRLAHEMQELLMKHSSSNDDDDDEEFGKNFSNSTTTLHFSNASSLAENGNISPSPNGAGDVSNRTNSTVIENPVLSDTADATAKNETDSNRTSPKLQHQQKAQSLIRKIPKSACSRHSYSVNTTTNTTSSPNSKNASSVITITTTVTKRRFVFDCCHCTSLPQQGGCKRRWGNSSSSADECPKYFHPSSSSSSSSSSVVSPLSLAGQSSFSDRPTSMCHWICVAAATTTSTTTTTAANHSKTEERPKTNHTHNNGATNNRNSHNNNNSSTSTPSGNNHPAKKESHNHPSHSAVITQQQVGIQQQAQAAAAAASLLFNQHTVPRIMNNCERLINRTSRRLTEAFSAKVTKVKTDLKRKHSLALASAKKERREQISEISKRMEILERTTHELIRELRESKTNQQSASSQHWFIAVAGVFLCGIMVSSVALWASFAGFVKKNNSSSSNNNSSNNINNTSEESTSENSKNNVKNVRGRSSSEASSSNVAGSQPRAGSNTMIFNSYLSQEEEQEDTPRHESEISDNNDPHQAETDAFGSCQGRSQSASQTEQKDDEGGLEPSSFLESTRTMQTSSIEHDDDDDDDDEEEEEDLNQGEMPQRNVVSSSSPTKNRNASITGIGVSESFQNLFSSPVIEIQSQF